MRAAIALLLTFMLGLGNSAASGAQAQSFRLAPADLLSSGTHLILTVPLDDADELATVAVSIERRFDVTLMAEWPLRSIAVHCFVVNAGERADLDDLIARMRADAQIRSVQRTQDFNTFESHYADPLFPIQSALTQLNAVAAQRFSTGSGVRVGVVDSAIDSTHPDLAGRLAELHDFVGDGQQDIAESHGTAIAGIIAADAANAQGIVGVAPEAELVVLRACWQAPGEPGRCNSFSLARALNFAILNQIDVVNISLGGPPDPLLEELVRAAVDSGLVVIAAWGEAETATFPASVPGVIAAGGSAADRRIPAPAVDVISTAPHNDYRYFSGSSVAAAHVAGVASLLLAARPDLRPDDIARALRSAVTVRDNTPMLDACQALHTVAGEAVSCLQ